MNKDLINILACWIFGICIKISLYILKSRDAEK